MATIHKSNIDFGCQDDITVELWKQVIARNGKMEGLP